jgi:hypothetical protein
MAHLSFYVLNPEPLGEESANEAIPIRLLRNRRGRSNYHMTRELL